MIHDICIEWRSDELRNSMFNCSSWWSVTVDISERSPLLGLPPPPPGAPHLIPESLSKGPAAGAQQPVFCAV